jgi:uncharacterized protein CbrC (UPF0167 family)
MPKKEREPQPFPAWLVTALACRVCGGPAWRAGEHGMVCRKVPAHTGHLGRGEVEDRTMEALALAKARGLTDWSREKAVVMAQRYLKASARAATATEEVLW